MSSAPRPHTSPSTRSPGPRVTIPLGGSRARVRVAEERERRPSPPLISRRGSPARARGRTARLDPVARQVVAQGARRQRLVPRRVDGVQAEQRLEQPGDLVSKRHRGASILSACPTSSPRQPGTAGGERARSPCGSDRRSSTSSSASNTSSAGLRAAARDRGGSPALDDPVRAHRAPGRRRSLESSRSERAPSSRRSRPCRREWTTSAR
jgi:hypothetical protein